MTYFRYQQFVTLMILELILAYWISISSLAIAINLKSFKKFKSYSQFKNQKGMWQGLIRDDYKSWKKTNILIGSFTIFPLKFAALANFLIIAFVFALVISALRQGELKEKVIKFLNFYFNNYGKLMNNLSLNIQDNCKTPEQAKIKTPIVISNHSNWFDTFYITLKYSPVSFVAKYEIKYWPIIGPLTRALNCIYVKRQSEKQRNTVRDQIKQRINDFYQGKSHASPLAIFPQGTTSNNRVILNFKSGAFQNLSPLTMFCLRYECDGYLTGEDEVEQSQNIFLMLSQPLKLIVTKIQMRPQTNQTPQAYKQRCRDVMASTLKIKKVGQGFRDRLDLQKFRKTGVITE